MILGATQKIVLYTCAIREAQKNCCLFPERDSREAQLGAKMCMFLRKRVLLDSIKGYLVVIFQT